MLAQNPTLRNVANLPLTLRRGIVGIVQSDNLGIVLPSNWTGSLGLGFGPLGLPSADVFTKSHEYDRCSDQPKGGCQSIGNGLILQVRLVVGGNRHATVGNVTSDLEGKHGMNIGTLNCVEWLTDADPMLRDPVSNRNEPKLEGKGKNLREQLGVQSGSRTACSGVESQAR